MPRVTIEVPSQFADLSTTEQESLIRAGMREAIQARVNELTRELQEAETRIRHFEAKYGVPLSDFERDILPSLDDFEGHEAYNDWFFWENVRAEKSRQLASMQS